MAEVLSEYLRRQAAEPFDYCNSNCGTFVTGWFDLLTGKTAAAEWRGKFSDRETCEAYVESLGGIRSAACAFLPLHYGADPTVPAVGNAVLAELRGIAAMGLRVSLDGTVALRLPAGLVFTRRAAIIEEWGLPCPS